MAEVRKNRRFRTQTERENAQGGSPAGVKRDAKKLLRARLGSLSGAEAKFVEGAASQDLKKVEDAILNARKANKKKK